MDRSPNATWHYQIKAATRDLVTAAGGVVRAGEVANVSNVDRASVVAMLRETADRLAAGPASGAMQ